MNNNVILKVENLSKQYRLGTVGTGTISHDLNRLIAKIRGKEDPYLKIGESNDRASKGNSQYVWALKDINFEVERGEILGLIGKNGAGKSTLLKILSKVTGPTKGKVKSKGRIASLLEVGTGFHPEMTGKENIFLNGAILGMTKKEIQLKLNEIVSFSGCERYIDTPVKRYSSGMKVRLAFAVAAHLEPDILVVDEVLAVGDAEFQKKAIGKMQDISNSEGRTVLFVSHNMAALKSLCTRAIVLDKGEVVFGGNPIEAINFYKKNKFKEIKQINWDFNKSPGNNLAKLKSIEIINKESDFYIENDIKIEINYFNLKSNQTLNLSVSVYDNNDTYILASPNLERKKLEKGEYKSTLIIPANFLNIGKYYFTILLIGDNFEIIAEVEKIISIELIEKGTYRKGYFGFWSGVVRPYLNWDNKLIEEFYE